MCILTMPQSSKKKKVQTIKDPNITPTYTLSKVFKKKVMFL
jgi:hypothetical protein